MSPESQTEAAAAIRRALFGNERSARRVSASSGSIPELPDTSADTSADPLVAPNAPSEAPRVAALAAAGLERLAASLGDGIHSGDAVANHIVGRIRALAADLLLDFSGRRGEGIGRAMVYFVEAVGAGRVKIGVAADPEARIANLQTACPHPLRLLGAIPGGREVEASLHGRFRDYHLGGEWFFLAKPVAALIARLTAPPASGAPA